MAHTRKSKKPCKCGIKGYCKMTKPQKEKALYARRIRNLKIARSAKAMK